MLVHFEHLLLNLWLHMTLVEFIEGFHWLSGVVLQLSQR